MTDSDRIRSIRRILVALDASSHSLAAVEAAVELAARLEAELSGLFVEDVELLRLAECPGARELLYPSATEAPLSRATMESRLRAQSEQARKALGAAAERLRVRWTFRTVRGPVTPAILAAATEADLLAMGTVGWSFGPLIRMGSTATGVLTSGVPVLLISEERLPHDVRLVVYYDGSAAARRSVMAAEQLAKPGTNGITVLLAAAKHERFSALRDEVTSLLKDKGIEVRYREVDPQDEMSLFHALKSEQPGSLVLGGRELLKKLRAMGPMQREIGMPLLLLDGPEPEAA